MTRSMIRRAALAAFLAVMASGAIAQSARPPVVYVVRHFDTPAGERDPDLTAVGAARAAALVRWFAKKPLHAIYVTPFKRTAQTVAPLAAARGLTPIVYGPAPSADFLASLKTMREPILIVGHSNTVPDIIAALGGTRPAPLAHPDFGDVWTIEGGRTTTAKIAPR